MKHRYERVTLRVAEWFKLHPSRWLPKATQPRIPASAAGVYTVAYPIRSKEVLAKGEGGLDYDSPSYYPAMNLYEVMSSWCFARRKAAGKDPFSGWGGFWSFLFEVSIGVFDDMSDREWVEVNRPRGEVKDGATDRHE